MVADTSQVRWKINCALWHLCIEDYFLHRLESVMWTELTKNYLSLEQSTGTTSLLQKRQNSFSLYSVQVCVYVCMCPHTFPILQHFLAFDTWIWKEVRLLLFFKQSLFLLLHYFFSNLHTKGLIYHSIWMSFGVSMLICIKLHFFLSIWTYFLLLSTSESYSATDFIPELRP